MICSAGCGLWGRGVGLWARRLYLSRGAHVLYAALRLVPLLCAVLAARMQVAEGETRSGR